MASSPFDSGVKQLYKQVFMQEHVKNKFHYQENINFIEDHRFYIKVILLVQ